MAVLTASNIDVSQISDQQIGACHKVFEGSTAFYMVESATSDQEYSVRFLCKAKGFSCTCKAGQNGRLCWHVKASIAAAREERTALQAIEEAERIATQARIEAANERAAEKPISKAKAYAPVAFSILR